MTDSYMIRADQQTNSNGADTNFRTVWGTRSGLIGVNTAQGLVDQWTRAGKVFSAEFTITQAATLTATIEANATVDLTEPFFRLTIPTGYVFVPIALRVESTTVWVTADYIGQFYSDTNTYNAGGVAATVRNLAHPASTVSGLASSVATSVYDGDSVLTESALTNPVLFGSKTFVTGGLATMYEYNILKGDPIHYLRGVGSWGAFAQANAAHEVLYQAVWAELNKNEIFND